MSVFEVESHFSKMSNEEETIQCPYNSAHFILKSRMATHLIKCRQNHSLEKHVTCPLNATHDVPEAEIEYHLKNCPDRKNLEKSIYVMEEPKPIDRESLDVEVPACSENWDEETCPGESYLNVKEEIIKKNLVFRQPVGRSKAGRKEFFKNEVKRFGECLPQSKNNK